MSFLGVKNSDELKIDRQNREILSEYIPFEYQKEFLQSIGIKKLHDRIITMDEINIFLNQYSEIDQVKIITQRKEREKYLDKLLFTDDDTDDSIQYNIDESMKNITEHENSTNWMKNYPMVSDKESNQITAEGFNVIIEQNKILIRQNELIRRQNEKIIELLKKIKVRW